jgi:hypothetical protein
MVNLSLKVLGKGAALLVAATEELVGRDSFFQSLLLHISLLREKKSLF